MFKYYQALIILEWQYFKEVKIWIGTKYETSWYGLHESTFKDRVDN